MPREREKGKFRMALIEAVKVGDHSAIMSLFIRGGDFTVTDDQGNTLPMIAAISGHTRLFSTLNMYGSSFKGANHKGETVTSLAIKHQRDCNISLIIHDAD